MTKGRLKIQNRIFRRPLPYFNHLNKRTRWILGMAYLLENQALGFKKLTFYPTTSKYSIPNLLLHKLSGNGKSISPVLRSLYHHCLSSQIGFPIDKKHPHTDFV